MTEKERLESHGIFVDDLTFPSEEEQERMLRAVMEAKKVLHGKSHSKTISGTFGTFNINDIKFKAVE